jgi:hypothetical protein
MEGIQGFGIVLPESAFRQGQNVIQIIDLENWAKTTGFHPEWSEANAVHKELALK